jgi:hypothetical protein
MGKYAQILYGKAHWIFERNDVDPTKWKNIKVVDITDKPEVQEGWNYDEATGTFSEPPEWIEARTMTPKKINALYLPQFEALQKSYAAALITGNAASAAAIQADYQFLLNEYNMAVKEVTGDE